MSQHLQMPFATDADAADENVMFGQMAEGLKAYRVLVDSWLLLRVTDVFCSHIFPELNPFILCCSLLSVEVVMNPHSQDNKLEQEAQLKPLLMSAFTNDKYGKNVVHPRDTCSLLMRNTTSN